MKRILLAAFLLLALVGGAVILLRVRETVRPYPYPGAPEHPPALPRTETLYAMGGIPVQITLYGESEESFREHRQAAAGRIEELESLLSDFRPESPVSRLNRSAGGEGVAVGPVVMEVLDEALHLREITGGAYDPTVRPLVTLWRRAEERQAVPTPEEIREALGMVGTAGVLRDRERGIVRLARKGMEVDFGGLAKGYIVDRVVEFLRERGVGRGIVNAGGDLRAFCPEGVAPFTIGIRDPDGSPTDPVGTLPLGNGAVGTSGNYERFLEIEGRRYGHILDPRTGYPARGTLSATVRAPTAVQADGLATAVYVLGPEKGMELIESLPEVEGVILFRDESGVHRRVSNGLKEVRWVRKSTLAGRWYESDPGALRSELRRYLERARRSSPPGRPVALIAPHAAYRYSGQGAAFGYRAIRDAGFHRVVVMGVSHYAGFQGASVPPASHYETPLGRVPVDTEATQALLRTPLFHTVPEAHEREHSVEIQLPFLQEVLGDFSLVPILFGRLRREDFPQAAEAIRSIWNDRTLLIASSDFTHFGARFRYIPFEKEILLNLRELDAGAVNAALRMDPEGFLDYHAKTGITVCGWVPITVLLHLLPAERTLGTLLSYYTSAEMSRDYSNSVSYATLLFTAERGQPRLMEAKGSGRTWFAPPGPRFLGEEAQRYLLQASRRTLDGFIREKRVPPLEEGLADLEGLRENRGTFVTLNRRGRLRGCIGNIEPTVPLFRSVLENTIRAAVHDRRFRPVGPEELDEIEIEISVLGPPSSVKSPEEILLGWQGIILEKGGFRSVFLPEVAPKYGWSRSETLDRLAQKAGLPADAWREATRLSIFETQTFGEEDFSGF